MEFVFIIGIARTGSKIYKNILNEYSEINVLNEMHFLAPRRVRKDFRYYIKKYFGDIKTKTDVSKLVDLMYSGTLDGTFWTSEPWDVPDVQNSIIGIDKDKLKNEILNSSMSYKDIFKILLEQHTIARNKKRGGAKFPVDISYVPKLMEWFPNSQFVHIVRDPRAIYSSMVLRDTRKLSKPTKIKECLIKIKRLFYLWRQYKQAIKIHKKYNKMDNYYISRFEDIVSQPEKYIKDLCNFLKIDFKPDMVYPPVVDSSYGEVAKNKGFDKKTLSRWKNHISSKSETVIKLLLRNEMKEMEYL